MNEINHQINYQLSWVNDTDCCDPNLWPGISCSLSRVYYVNLKLKDISGELPPSIGKLQYLRYLWLQENDFHGSIPESYFNLKQLEQLLLYKNSISDILSSSISNLTNLVEINIANNNFSGLIPTEIGNLKELTHVDLSINKFEGHFPKSFSNLKKLIKLNLYTNKLEGKIPPEIFLNCTSLEEIRWSWNYFIGEIPKEISLLKNLSALNLKGNKLEGLVPNNLPSKLTTLYLAKNYFSGNLNFLQNLTSLEHLYLEDNFFDGIFPLNLNFENITELYLSNNNIQGDFPEYLLTDFPLLTELMFDHNNITGKVPNQLGNKFLSIRDFFRNEFECPIPKDKGYLYDQNFLTIQCGCPKGQGGDDSYCSICLKGNYSDIWKISECKSCLKGSYSDIEGAYNCNECPKGTYSNISMSTFCYNCSAGFYLNSLGNTDILDCNKCPKGTWSNEKSSSCNECGVGKFSNISGASSILDCKDCNPGTFSNISNSTECNNCPKGTYSTSNGATSIETCVDCWLGSWSDIEGASSSDSCILCSFGKYSDTEKATSIDNCYNCPKGTYNENQGTSNIESCNDCPVGSWSDIEGASSSEVCNLCPLGTYSEIRKSISIDNCTFCPKGTYNDKEGGSSLSDCKECPSGTYSNNEAITSLNDCFRCSNGYFSNETKSEKCYPCEKGFEPNIYKSKCIKCPIGKYNNEIGSECKKCPENEISISEGMIDCQLCSNEGTCIGGSNCQEGRDPNTLCSKCKENFYLLNSKCKKCPEKWVPWIVLSLIIIIISILFFYRNKFYILKKIRGPLGSVIFFNIQLLAVILSLKMDWPLTTLQPIRDFTSIFNLEINIIAAPECFETFSFTNKWLLMFLSPFIIITFLLGNFFLFKKLNKILTNNPNVDKLLKERIIYGITLILKYLYIPLSMAMLEPFGFTEQNDGSETLNSDSSITKNSQEYQNYLPGFIIGLIIYVIGLPIFFTILLLFAKKSGFNEWYSLRIGWLFLDYKVNRFWWELIEVIFKLLFVSSNLIKWGDIKILHSLYIIFLLIIFIILCYLYKPRKTSSSISWIDSLMIGLLIIQISIVSLSIQVLKGFIFIILYPLGIILVFKCSSRAFNHKNKNDIELNSIEYSSKE